MTNSMIHETLKEHLEILEKGRSWNDQQWKSLWRILELTRRIVAEELLLKE